MGRHRELVTVVEAERVLGVSRSTIYRLIRSGELASLRQAGRRLVPARALSARMTRSRSARPSPPFTAEHPLWRLVGAYRSGGRRPGSEDKHAVLSR